MMNFCYVLSFFLLSHLVSATDFFTSLKLTSTNANSALDMWETTLGFSLSEIKAGTTYTLDMPYIYRVKFDGTESVLYAKVDGTNVIECTVTQGSYIMDHSTLSCTVLEAAESFKALDGSLKFYVLFSTGGSAHAVEIAASTHWSAGENTVTWGDLSTTVTFAPVETNKGLYLKAHTTGYGSAENYLLFPECGSDGSVSITYDATVDGQGEIDCSLVEVHVSNEFNDFMYPTSYGSNDNLFLSCSDNTVSIVFMGVPAGSRVWVTSWQYQSISDMYFKNIVEYDLTCDSGSTSGTTTQSITVTNNEAEGTAIPLYLTTEPWGGCSTALSTTIHGSVGTVAVLTPTSQCPVTSSSSSIPEPTTLTTTRTSTWTETYGTTTTESYPSTTGDLTITVDVNLPGPTTTTTTRTFTWSESYATTTTEPYSSTTGDLTITVDVQLPKPTTLTTTRTSTWTETYSTTTTEPYSSTTGDLTITVDVNVPASSSKTSVVSSSVRQPVTTTTTLTYTWIETYETTTTEPYPSTTGDLTITVDVLIPELTSSFDEPTTLTTTRTSTWTETYETTTTEPYSSTTGDLTITVDVNVPAPYTETIEASSSETFVGTTTLAPAESTFYVPTTSETPISSASTVESSFEVPAESSSEVPVHSSSEIPIESSSEVPVESSSEVPVESTSEASAVSSSDIYVTSPSSESLTVSSSIDTVTPIVTITTITTNNITQTTLTTVYPSASSFTGTFTSISPEQPEENEEDLSSSTPVTIATTEDQSVYTTSTAVPSSEVTSFSDSDSTITITNAVTISINTDEAVTTSDLATTPEISTYAGSGNVLKCVSSFFCAALLIVVM